MEVCLFFTLWLFLQKNPPEIQKVVKDASQNGAKLAIGGCRLANLAPSWRRLGANLGHLGAKKGPSLLKFSAGGDPTST